MRRSPLFAACSAAALSLACAGLTDRMRQAHTQTCPRVLSDYAAISSDPDYEETARGTRENYEAEVAYCHLHENRPQKALNLAESWQHVSIARMKVRARAYARLGRQEAARHELQKIAEEPVVPPDFFTESPEFQAFTAKNWFVRLALESWSHTQPQPLNEFISALTRRDEKGLLPLKLAVADTQRPPGGRAFWVGVVRDSRIDRSAGRTILLVEGIDVKRERSVDRKVSAVRAERTGFFGREVTLTPEYEERETEHKSFVPNGRLFVLKYPEVSERLVRMDAVSAYGRYSGTDEKRRPELIASVVAEFRPTSPVRKHVLIPEAATTDPRPTTTTETEPAELSQGTGFVVTPDGGILTAYHVVEGARTISVSLPRGRHEMARVARKNEKLDLALLEIETETPAYLSIAESTSVEAGEPVWTVGFPVVGFLGLEPKFTDGAVSALSGPKGSEEVYQITVPIQPGNSGGPLVTEQGHVVGVVTSSAAALPFLRATGALPQGINWAVKADQASGLFEAPEEQPPAASRTDAVARVKDALCLVETARGDGLLDAPADFGKGFTPTAVKPASYEKLRKSCQGGKPTACLSVARILVGECNGRHSGTCKDQRYARTILAHACAVGRRVACRVLRDHPPD